MAALILVYAAFASALGRGLFFERMVAVLGNNAVAATTGTVALSAPFWLNLVSPAHQVAVAILGLFVLVLTIRAKILDLKIKSAALREALDRCGERAGPSDG